MANVIKVSTPLVSVIVPIYNVETYLTKCLESIKRIDYKPIEVILVDDASPDSCGKIIDDYVKNNTGWIAIHKPLNEGVARARISGEARSSGDYVMYVDPDDYVHPEILQRLVSVAIKYKSDIVTCGFYVDDGQKLTEDRRNNDAYYDKAAVNHSLSSRFLFDDTIGMAAFPLFMWGKLYLNRKEILLEHLEKGSGIMHAQDLVTIVSLLINSIESIACIKDPLYYYVKRPGQITGKHPIVLFNERVRVWGKLDEMNDGRLSSQITSRIWTFIKITLYGAYSLYSYTQYKSFIQYIKDIPVINKYVFGPQAHVKREIRNHPHFIFIKNHLYWLDYLLSKYIVKRR